MHCPVRKQSTPSCSSPSTCKPAVTSRGTICICKMAMVCSRWTPNPWLSMISRSIKNAMSKFGALASLRHLTTTPLRRCRCPKQWSPGSRYVEVRGRLSAPRDLFDTSGRWCRGNLDIQRPPSAEWARLSRALSLKRTQQKTCNASSVIQQHRTNSIYNYIYNT